MSQYFETTWSRYTLQCRILKSLKRRVIEINMVTKFTQSHHKTCPSRKSPRDINGCKEVERRNSFLVKHHSNMKNSHKEKGCGHIGNLLTSFSTATTPCSENSVPVSLRKALLPILVHVVWLGLVLCWTRDPGMDIQQKPTPSHNDWFRDAHVTQRNRPELISELSRATGMRGSLFPWGC